MEARMKKFLRTFSISSSPDVKGYSYESATPQKSPVKGPGLRDLRDYNGHTKQSLRGRATKRQPEISSESAQAPPDIVREVTPPWDTNADTCARRSQSLDLPPVRTQSRRSKQSGRTFSGFSMANPPSLFNWRKPSISSIAKNFEASQPNVNEYIPPVPCLHARKNSQHVDIFTVSSQKHHASGRRDYGEDVADRNMSPKDPSRRASITTFNLDSPEFNYMRSIYSRAQETSHRESKSRDDSRSSQWDHDLKEDSINDDVVTIVPLSPRPMVTSISSNRRKSRRDRTKKSRSSFLSDDDLPDANSIFVTTTRKTSVISTYQPTGKPTHVTSYPFPPSNSRALPTGSESSTNSFASTSSHGKVSTRGIMRDGMPMDRRGIKRSLDKSQWNNAPSEKDKSNLIDKSTIPVHSNNRIDAAVSNLDNLPNFIRQKPTTVAIDNRPITPPFDSKTNCESPLVFVGTPKKIGSSPSKYSPSKYSPSKPSSGTRSRANSATYSPFPKAEPNPLPSFSGKPNQILSNIVNTALHTSTKYASVPNPTEPRLESAIEPPSVNLGETVDTEASTHTLPAAANEATTPQAHHNREEKVAREIHAHNVFHRVLPIIEKKILPKKHYVGKKAEDLAEIPTPAMHSRQANWQVPESPRSSTSSDSVAPPSIATNRACGAASMSMRKQSASLSDRLAIASTRASTMTSGEQQTETTWRHPPALDIGDQGTKESPRLSTRKSGDSYDDETISSRSRRSEDSGLLFRDTGYGGIGILGGGMLPGLLERSPMASPEGEATRALRRKNEELDVQKRLGNMNLSCMS